MHRHDLTVAALAALLLATMALADSDDGFFESDQHCVAYRTIKGMFFGVDVEVVGRSCDVTASLQTEAAEEGPRIVVSVPIESFRSGNFLRDGAVSDLLGADDQPEIHFTSEPVDAESLRADVERGRFVLPGVLKFGGQDHPVDFPLELVEQGERHYVKGHLETTFEHFAVEVPTIAFGLVAAPHEELELIAQLELESVAGLEEWATKTGLLRR